MMYGHIGLVAEIKKKKQTAVAIRMDTWTMIEWQKKKLIINRTGRFEDPE